MNYLIEPKSASSSTINCGTFTGNCGTFTDCNCYQGGNCGTLRVCISRNNCRTDVTLYSASSAK